MSENPDNPVLVPHESLDAGRLVHVRVTAIEGGYYLDNWYADGLHSRSMSIHPPGSYIEIDLEDHDASVSSIECEMDESDPDVLAVVPLTPAPPL